ncbi:MAG: arginase family protein [Parvibaculaceae bacterium]
MTNGIRSLRPSGTFMGIPHASALRPGQAAVIGLPFDCGAHPTRVGCRQGPRAIREQSGLVRPFYPPLSDTNVLEDFEAVDLGDADVTSADVEPSLAAIERVLDDVFSAGGYPVTMGGDGLVTLPQLRALHRHYGDAVVLHIDAHTDSYPGEGYNTGITFTRAAEEGLVDTSRSFHVGARGTLALSGAYDHTRSLGYHVITGQEVADDGLPAVVAELRRTIGTRPVYLCFDMDYFDPSAAPGVATPTWGGPGTREVFALLHELKGLKIVALDVNTVSPPHDVGGMTAYLAGTVMLVGMHLMALGRNVG